METVNAAGIVGEALTSLSTDVATVIPAALGIAVLVFGASYLWRKAKTLVS